MYFILFYIGRLPNDDWFFLKSFYKKLHRLGDEYVAKNNMQIKLVKIQFERYIYIEINNWKCK